MRSNAGTTRSETPGRTTREARRKLDGEYALFSSRRSRTVNRPTLLVPIRVPLKEPGKRTVTHAVDRAAELGGAHLYILHVNLLYRDESVTRPELARHVEETTGPLPDASYHTRETFFLEEAILDEASHLEPDYVVIGRSRRRRWRRLLANRLGTSVDLESFLRRHLDAELVVV